MPDAATRLTRLCPACDYNLEGNTTGRCPECGIVVGLGPISKIPWVHRRQRGERRAYFETMKLLLFSPGVLARETARRVALPHARRFHRESLLLATIFGSGILVIAFLLRGPFIDTWISPDFRQLLATTRWFLPATPAYVLSDTLFVVIPLVPAVFLSLHASAFLYRRLFGIGRGVPAEAARARHRSAVLAHYASGLAPLLTMALGGMMISLTARTDLTMPTSWAWRFAAPAGLVLCPLLAVWVYYVPTVTFLRRAGHGSRLRSIALLLLYPVLQPFVWLAVSAGVFWVVGYVLIAVYSMMQ